MKENDDEKEKDNLIILTDKDDDKKDEKEILQEKKMQDIFMNSFTLEDESLYSNDIKEKDDEDDDIGKGTKSIGLMKIEEKKEKFVEIYDYKNVFDQKKKIKNFNIFYKSFKSNNDEEIQYKFGKILLFTYNKNFPKITNYKTKKTYSTDAWWGCMIRCGQMILAHGIYLLLKGKNYDTKTAIERVVPLFNEYPIKTTKFDIYFYGMIEKYDKLRKNDDENSEKKIKDVLPPFSIKTLCDVGELFERTAGEWFSDVIITRIFCRINNYFELLKSLNVEIFNFQTSIEIPEILEKCFEQKDEDIKGRDDFMISKGKKYYFNKMALIFVNVRVGLEKIPEEYYKGIKNLFDLKQCIGIIGGQKRLAYYFIGYHNESNSLLYLDPHVTKEALKTLTLENILKKYVAKEIHLLKLSKMTTAFTIGYCFRNYKEFLNLFNFWQKAKTGNIPILGVIKSKINLEINDDILEKEDISPAYEDKDEDDW